MNPNPTYPSLKIREALFSSNPADELYPLFSGHQPCPPRHSSDPIRDHYLLCCVKSGHGTFYNCSPKDIREDSGYWMGPGDIFMITPAKHVYYVADENDPWTYAWIAFSGRAAKKYMDRTDFSEKPVIHTELPLYERIYHLTETAISLRSSELRYMYAVSFLWKMLADLIASSSSVQTLPKPNDYVDRAVNIIRYRYHKDLTVSDIACELGISREYFYTLFKSHTGKSPSRYLIEFRIEKACALLYESDYPVYLIAEHTGFTDQTYFSRKFHEITGMSPAAYRKYSRN